MVDLLQHEAQSLQRDLSAWRRHLHAHPELSGQEKQTARFVADHLRKLGYEPRENVGGTCGVIADLTGGRRPAVALRADMDALPVTEENDVPYKSQHDGVMHACGHDAHTAMLLGAARLLAARRDELAQSVRLIFQPHEEFMPGGAAPMIADGALDGVERIFGLHIWSQLPCGQLGVRPGPFMASPSDLKITVRGVGGHAAMPQECADPIVAAAHVITALQTAVSRSIAASDTAVVSVTQIHGGTTFNVIPPTVELGGTIRTFDAVVRARIAARIAELAEHTARAHGASAEVRIEHGYPALVNDPVVLEQVIAAARAIGLTDDDMTELPLQGGGEDFAYYCESVPGAFVFLGGGKPAPHERFPHHHPRFDIDETALPIGAALAAQVCLGG